MKTFAARRVRNLTLCAVALTTILAWTAYEHRTLGHAAFTTGYLLLAALVLLAGYNVRKKLPQLPLGTSATWLQIHIYVGVGTLVVFAIHAGPTWPNGWLEATLAGVYLLTVTSGALGLYFTRTFPAQLARVGEEFIFERIPTFRRELRDRARQLVFEAVEGSGTTTVADFYTNRLYDFFEGPRGWRYTLRPTTRLRRALLSEMQDQTRYLSEAERGLFEQLFALVRKKDDLDFQAARQGVLKGWLFIHIALTYTLLLLAMVHGFTAHVYWGGAL